MAFLDIVNKFKKDSKVDFNKEQKSAESIQDEVKIYNERFPSWLEPLEVMARGISDGDSSDSFQGGQGGVGGGLQFVEKGKYWTSSSIKNHDLGYTTSTLTVEQLDDWLNSRTKSNSQMRGKGAVFMKAGEESGLDPRYLIGHGAWESGWGNPSNSINRDKNNFFGIGAFDHAPKDNAYQWNSIDEGIIGGAKWIAENYYEEGQTTLHKMIYGKKEYATSADKWIAGIEGTMRVSEQYTTPSEGAAPDSVGSFEGNFKLPFKTTYKVMSEFGMRIHPLTGKRKLHAGIDLSSNDAAGTKLYPVAPGTIVTNEYHSGWGNYIVINHGEYKGKDLYTLYAHMKAKGPLSVGTRVDNNTSIGIEGTTGSSTGVHLHLEFILADKGSGWSGQNKRKDPRGYMKF